MSGAGVEGFERAALRALVDVFGALTRTKGSSWRSHAMSSRTAARDLRRRFAGGFSLMVLNRANHPGVKSGLSKQALTACKRHAGGVQISGAVDAFWEIADGIGCNGHTHLKRPHLL